MAREVKFDIIVSWVKDNIQSGEWKTGDKIPSENELSRKFELSRQTVRHALEVLEAQQMVERIHGSGTYVGSKGFASGRKQYQNIAVISTYYDYYIFPPTLHGIESVLSREGYRTTLSFTNDSIHHERTILKGILERDDVDGMIVEPAKSGLPNPNLPLYQELIDRKIPILFFNASYPQLERPCVRIDDAKIAGKATELLIEAGHTQIAAILNAEDGQGHLRYSGYLQAMWKHHLRTDAKKTVLLDSDMIRDLKSVESYLLDCLDGVTGVLCYNDEAAYQLIELLGRHGIRVPQDLSIVSIDDASIASMGEFTSFPHPKEELGKKTAENLLKMIENPAYDGNYLFDAEPALRKSILPPKAER